MQTTTLTIFGQRLTYGPDNRWSSADSPRLADLLNEFGSPPFMATHEEAALVMCHQFFAEAPENVVTTGEPEPPPPTNAVPGFPPPPP